MGPLTGIRVIELAGIGPAPLCALLRADMGATVLRVERRVAADLGIARSDRFNVVNRGRPSACIDLKKPEGIALALDLIAQADILIEGFRPGTMERIGLGPEPCFARNERLIYGRMTGWGQDGPLAHAAGHDLNYIAITGALDAIGRAGAAPTPPLNLVGDYGGGSLYLAFGLLCAVIEAQRSGKGQVVDAAIIDGAASLMTGFFGMQAAGLHNGPRGTNILDSGAPYYEVYLCADGRYVSVAPIERKFRSEFYRRIGLDESTLPDAGDPTNWPALKKIIAERMATKTQAEWCALLEGTDACFAPVLSTQDVTKHPHNAARGTFVEIDGIVQPAPAPRFSRSKPALPTPPEEAGASTDSALAAWGIADERIAHLRATGIIGRMDTP
jgi:alpha-methylacyl-CoA racemase